MDINKLDTDAQYSHEYSNFPQKVIEPTTYKDVDDSVGATVNEIKRLRAVNDFSTATKRIRENIEKLKQYFVSATDINRFVEELRNTQIFALKKRKLVYIEKEQPEAEFEGDVWLDVDNSVEDPEENENLVHERNKVAEDYESEISDLQSKNASLNVQASKLVSTQNEVNSWKHKYSELEKTTQLSSSEVQKKYQDLYNQSETDRVDLIDELKNNDVEITDNTSTIHDLIYKIIDVRSGGNLIPSRNIDPRIYVPSRYSWYAGRELYQGIGKDNGTLNLAPTKNEKYTGEAGYYRSINIDFSGVYNSGLQAGIEQGKSSCQLKIEKVGSGTYVTYTLPESYKNYDITINNFFIVPTKLNVAGNISIMATKKSDVAFTKKFENNKLIVENNNVEIRVQDSECLAGANIEFDVYLVYLKK